MPDLFDKSAEQLAAVLLKPVIEVGDAIAHANFFQFPRDTSAYGRFFVGVHVFSCLLCSHHLTSLLGEEGHSKAFETQVVIEEMHCSHLTRKWNPTLPIASVVVWEVEARSYQRLSGSPALKGSDLNLVELPVADILRTLYAVRGLRLVSDMLDGSMDQLQRPHATAALLMPACRTLILQTTGKAADEGSVLRFTISVDLQWMFLYARIKQTLGIRN